MNRIQEELVYDNERVLLYNDVVRFRDGTTGRHIRFRYRNAECGAVVVPMTRDGRMVLLRMLRYAIDEESLEFPRGNCDAGEAADAAARRELLEETGLELLEIRQLGWHYPDNAIMTTQVGVYLALVDVSAGITPFDSQEDIVGTSVLTRDEVWRHVRHGGIRDGFTLGALALLRSWEEAGDRVP